VRLMTGSAAEFIRTLQTAFGSAVDVADHRVTVSIDGVSLIFSLTPAPPLRLGLLELARQTVEIAVGAGSEAAVAELLAKIDRATQRGGG